MKYAGNLVLQKYDSVLYDNMIMFYFLQTKNINSIKEFFFKKNLFRFPMTHNSAYVTLLWNAHDKNTAYFHRIYIELYKNV